MSSATINRPPGSMQNAGRSTRFGDFPTTGRPNGDDKMTQNSSIGQTYGANNTWQTSSGIWGNNPIGSSFANGKRDASRSRVTDDEAFDAPSGSGALAASSEADPWPRANGPWNADTNSPPGTSGSTSPVRSRGSNPSANTLVLSESQKTSPYLTTSRPAIGQGPGVNRNLQQKSNLDPASGAFKYPFANAPKFGNFGENNKENNNHFNGTGHDLDAYKLDARGGQGPGYRTVQSNTPRDSSLPPSRHSETPASGLSNGSFFANGTYPVFGHTPKNSIHSQRPSISGRTPSFASVSISRSFNGNFPGQNQDPEPTFSRNHSIDRGNHAAYLESPGSAVDQSFSPPGPYQDYDHPQTVSTTLWQNEGLASSKGLSSYLAGAYADGVFSGQLNLDKQSRSSGRGSISPGDDFRPQSNSPRFYSGNSSATLELEQAYLARGQPPQTVAELERGLQRLHFAQQQLPFFQHNLYNGQFQGQYPPHAYDYPPQQTFRPNSQQYNYGAMPMPPYVPTPAAPRGPARDQDIGHGVRSVLLEEFRSNSKSNRRFELKDIYNHVVEFSGDQHGSRFIQQKLETANSDEKEQIFREIQPNALQLMTDVFGNYVIQKLFEHGNQVQKKVLAEQMKNHVNELSVQMYGCRVVQKALEHVLADQQAALVKELEPDVLSCVKDQNGNHVVQKAIERVPTEHIQFIIDAFRGQVHTLATHPYGCRVIQRMLEYCSEKDQAAVLDELFSCATMLITDQYGNYVVQHVIAHGKVDDRARIIKIVTAQLLTFSKHKFASNVVEKSIQFCTDDQRHAIVAQLTGLHSDGSSPLQLMMKDQYGNYVIQKLLAQLKGSERDQLIEDIKPQLVALKKYNYGKQIAAIEKLIYIGPQAPHYVGNIPLVPASMSKTLPLDISSTAATPMLTMEQNSPQSSSLPSTTASTVDEPTEPVNSKLHLGEQPRPEVRIEAA